MAIPETASSYWFWKRRPEPKVLLLRRNLGCSESVKREGLLRPIFGLEKEPESEVSGQDHIHSKDTGFACVSSIVSLSEASLVSE
jgi:hypothetical protein